MAGTSFSARGDVKSEVGPVVVPEGRDYAAASIMKTPLSKVAAGFIPARKGLGAQ